MAEGWKGKRLSDGDVSEDVQELGTQFAARGRWSGWGCGTDVTECGTDVTECGTDVTECGTDVTECGTCIQTWSGCIRGSAADVYCIHCKVLGNCRFRDWTEDSRKSSRGPTRGSPQ
jgi:hypothetical protein